MGNAAGSWEPRNVGTRIAHVVDKLKGRMNSRGVALAALTAASALLAYIIFNKREPKAKELEEVIQVEQEEVEENVELTEVTNNEELQKGLEEECLETDKARRGKESLMEWIDRQLEEAERKTSGSPWPDIPQEESLSIAAESKASHDDGAAVDSDRSLDSPEVGKELSDVKREIKEAEKHLLGAELQLEEAEKCVSSQGGKYVLSGEIKRAADEREGTQAAGTVPTDNPKHSLDVVLEGSINPESNNDHLKAGKEEKSIDESSLGDSPPSCTIDNDQFDMSSDSEIELLKEPSIAGDDNETGQLLDETESEGEDTEDVTLDVSLKKEPAKTRSDTADNTPDEMIALRPAWQKNLSSKN